MPLLYLKCKTCNTEFSSGLGFDKKDFKRTVFTGTQHTCPKGHKHAYDKKDYYFKE